MRLQLFRYFTAFSLNVFAPVRNKPNLFNLQICNLSLGFGKRVLAWATATIQSDNDMTRPAATEKQQGQNQQKVPSQGKSSTCWLKERPHLPSPLVIVEFLFFTRHPTRPRWACIFDCKYFGLTLSRPIEDMNITTYCLFRSWHISGIISFLLQV